MCNAEAEKNGCIWRRGKSHQRNNDHMYISIYSVILYCDVIEDVVRSILCLNNVAKKERKRENIARYI